MYFLNVFSKFDFAIENSSGCPSKANISELFVLWDKNYFESCIQVKFEKEKFSVPVGYDEILSSYYGNYMALPSEDKRISTHVEQYFAK